ncbi:winged helix-turn-helix transcriptional regulator [Nocardia speluncae]|uniref:Winged helix-turn-helix transcriptional regulator n=1 Tax=Nocardia speluncae TaxID=419477 RepID=A0A846XAK3_9NOCA|nr:MarR family winged helix-turn-helix transcriptional regulator [Nocardia speluncae]NKY33311.1 winged helix-turn-helix transcriptional regulator [Nocardia speluncae]
MSVPVQPSNDQPGQNQDGAATRTWTAAQSDAAFEMLGDRLIDATRRFLRSNRRERIQSKLYTVNGRELGPAQIDAFEAVAQEGEIHMNRLAAQLGLDPSTVTRAVNPLVDLQLIERYTDPTNRRFVLLRCTPAGKEAITHVMVERRNIMRETLVPMAPERRLLLADLLEEYTTLFENTRAAAGS